MKYYRTITLVAPLPAFLRESPYPRRSSSYYAISVLAHIGGVGLLFGLSHVPRMAGTDKVPQFAMRVFDAPAQDPPQLQSAGGGGARSLPQVAANHPSAGGTPAPSAAAAPQFAQPIHQEQALVQPDAPSSLVVLPENPIPTIFKWTADITPIKPVIESRLQKSILANVRMSLEPPNRELNPSDVRMSSTNVSSALQKIRPSTTSPIVVRGPDPARPMPETASKPTDEPTPARILSLSDVRAQEGPVVIPLANSMGRPTSSNSLSAGQAVNHVEAGHGNSASNQPGVGSGHASGSPAKVDTGSGGGAQVGANSGPGKNTGGGPDSGGQDSGIRIELPKDGQFGVVVVGSSLADQYPEIADMWNGRLFYTVYLHVGAKKGWVLQYSLPLEAHAAASNGRPDAPWPYEIVRPRLDPDDFNSDALMVHGFVSSTGRFERLALVFPVEFAKAESLLGALREWQFRPARQNGKVASVEVLLIIPEETE